MNLDLVLEFSIAVELELSGSLDGGRDGDAKLDDDSAGLLGDEPDDAGVDVGDAVLVKDADDVADLLVGNAPVEVQLRPG